MQSELILKAWSLHPSASKIQKANFQLNGYANQDALKFCGPYKFANQIGFWLYSPVDIDITWKGGREFEHTIHGSYDNSDYKIINDLIKGFSKFNKRKGLSTEIVIDSLRKLTGTNVMWMTH